MDLIVIKQDGTTYKLSEYDMKVLKFNKGFPTMKNDDEESEGRDGFEDYGTFYVSRPLDAVIMYTARDRLDNPLVQNQIFRIFDSREMFYLIDDREPGKRWFAKCSNEFTPDQRNATFGMFDISFKAQPYAESVGTTLSGFDFDSELWGIEQGLIAEDETYIYEQSVNEFSIFNAGDRVIDPREIPMTIEYIGPSTNLKVENLTTGETWTYTGTSAGVDSIKLDGIRATKNGISIFRDTNRKVITLAKGWNNFKISGTTGAFVITFDFRFYYL